MNELYITRVAILDNDRIEIGKFMNLTVLAANTDEVIAGISYILKNLHFNILLIKKITKEFISKEENFHILSICVKSSLLYYDKYLRKWTTKTVMDLASSIKNFLDNRKMVVFYMGHMMNEDDMNKMIYYLKIKYLIFDNFHDSLYTLKYSDNEFDIRPIMEKSKKEKALNILIYQDMTIKQLNECKRIMKDYGKQDNIEIYLDDLSHIQVRGKNIILSSI